MATKIAFVDLLQDLEPLYVDGRYRRLFLVATWGYRPVGTVHINNAPPHLLESRYLKSTVQKAAAHRLWELSISGQLNSLQDNERALPPISVVVCTRDRAITLERCLSALQCLDYPDFEVVVVDNASKQVDLAPLVDSFGYRYVREERPGLDWARNRGIAESTHGLIAFIDDDAYATPGWLRGIAHGFANERVMAVTGMVLPAELETSAQVDFEIYGGMSKGLDGFDVDWDRLEGPQRFWSSGWGVGANMAFRRELFDQVGLFDPALDVGTATRGGGDIEFFLRLVASGYRLRYEPAAMVQHVHRRSDGALLQQINDNGRSFPAFLLTIARTFPELRRSLYWFGVRWWLCSWLVRRNLSRDKATRNWAMTELRGSFHAISGYYRARKEAARLLQTGGPPAQSKRANV